MKEWSIFQSSKVYVFSDSVLCLGKMNQKTDSNEAWKKRIEWITTSQSYRDFDGISWESTEFEWNIFPGFTTLQLCGKVNDLLSDLGETPEIFTGRIPFMSMFNDISCDKKDKEKECVANAKVVSLDAKRFGPGQWWFIGPGSEKKWYSVEEDSPQGIWDNLVENMLIGIRRKRMFNFPCNDSIVQVQAQKQRTRKTVDSLCCRPRNKWDYIFASLFLQISSVFTEQSRKCVKNMDPFTIDQGNLLKWWTINCAQWDQDRCSFGEWWTQHIRIFFCSNMKNELRGFDNKVFWVLLKFGSISWRKTLENNFMQWRVVNTLFQEIRIITTRRVDPGKHQNWTRIGNHDQ